MAEFQGGRGDGNKSGGKEPAQRKPGGGSHIQLDNKETKIAASLIALDKLKFDFKYLLGEDAKASAMFRSDRQFQLLPEQDAVTFLARDSALAKTTTPGVAVENHDQTHVRITIKPAELLAYLESDPIKAVIVKAQLHDRKLPVDDMGMGNADKLAGLGSDARAETTVTIPKALRALHQEIMDAKRGKDTPHASIAKHEGGRDT